jgi:hypothetical protein
VRAFRRAVVVLALASGCGDSCACGEREAGDAPAASTVAAAGSAAAVPAHAQGAAGAEAQIGEAASWLPAPDSELTRQLTAAQQALEDERMQDALAAQDVLTGPLGDRFAGLKADGELSSTVREGGDAKLAVAARNYKDGDRTVRVKITDTGLLPNARRVVSRRLTMIGNAAVGSERGAFVRGYPAVVAHFPEQQVSRASAVLANRYLVQVMVRGAKEPDDALRVIEQLDFGKLAPKQGKIPKPAPPPQ